MKTTLTEGTAGPILEHLRKANTALAARYPGDSGRRQPVHTVYGGAQVFKADTAPRLGALALRALEEYAPDPATFASAVGLPDRLAPKISERVLEKLRREPVEDFRIDFEDGYGNRPDAEEDGHAAQAAREVASGLSAGTLPPSIGIRIKPFTEELKRRSLRTLDIFLTELLDAGRPPPGELRRDAAQGHDPRAHLGARRPLRSARARPEAAGRRPAPRDHDRDAAGDPRRAGTGQRPLSRRGRPRPLCGRALRNLRLHGVPSDHRGTPAHGASLLRLRQARDAGRPGRNGRLALRRRDEHSSGADPSRGHRARSSTTARPPRTATPSTPPGNSTTATSGIRSRTPTTRAGTSTPRSFRPGTPPSTPSSSRDSTRPPRDSRISSRRPARRRSSAKSSTTPRRARAS